MTREAIVAAARRRCGIPFVHQGRTAEGLDCIGLVLNVAWELGFLPRSYDINGYTRMPDGSLFKECDRLLTRIPAPRFGCVLAMKFDAEPQHIGICGEHKGHLTIIHALAPGKATEHRLLTPWPSRIVGCFDFPGI